MSTWIFGYGSLIWRPDFPHDRREVAVVDGWARRFWQGSPDHRGVPGAPGRVVTLVAEPTERTWGVAYRITPADEPAILAALDHREKAGYAQLRLPMHLADGPVDGLVYVATPENPDWLGPADDGVIAATIAAAVGPSGTNREYLLRLADALRALPADDPHVFALEARVRGLR